ncbi:hypothetical protein COL8621_00388 [Actibacterium lipolyticum]|uniref:Histidine kinase/HSP90-like ATPase domain-containing protein n=2 Tax=Actibacterium lipolyticum TaxID=1524263 RepID=A0A238JL09_9RHOB|nr:hypothetical protein COL8621_00388 [Actibacterium lipolyticum]
MVQLLSAKAGRVLPPEAQGRFAICVSEALTNLVLHSKNSNPDAQIQIELCEQDTAVTVEIYDPCGADPFDLREYATDLSKLDVMAESGRGLGLIMACADHVTYDPVGNKHRLKLTINKEERVG